MLETQVPDEVKTALEAAAPAVESKITELLNDGIGAFLDSECKRCSGFAGEEPVESQEGDNL